MLIENNEISKNLKLKTNECFLLFSLRSVKNLLHTV